MASLDPLTDVRWLTLLEHSPGASVFHHPAWLELVGGHYGYRLVAAIAEDADGVPVAGLPMALVASRLTGRRLVAVPFADSCPPVVAAGAGADAVLRLASAVEEQRAAQGVPLVVHGPFPGLSGARSGAGYLQHVIPLEADVDAVEARFASRARRNTRKAIRLGLTHERRTDRDALDVFYQLHVATRRRLGVPTQPRRFIRELARLFDQGLGHVALIHRDGRPVAAAVFLCYGRSVVYKYGASDAAHLDARPNNLLFTEEIRAACAEGYAELDLGRTDHGQDGLAEFKRGWGAEERELVYTRVGGGGDVGSGRLEAALGGVIRRGPAWVGRAIGELLYRHAG